MTTIFKSVEIKEPSQSFTVTLPRHAIIFDVHKGQGDYGNSFHLCYHYNKEELAHEVFKFQIFKNLDETEDRDKLSYVGKYNMKFSSGIVFVFRQVAP